MIDFNETPEPVERSLDAEREEIRAALIANLESVLCTLFPAGKKRHGKFYIGDILGSPGDSLEIVLNGEKAGLWTDRADDCSTALQRLMPRGQKFVHLRVFWRTCFFL
jgi:putative DNA primase/helicase